MSIENVQATTDPLTLRIETLLAMYVHPLPASICTLTLFSLAGTVSEPHVSSVPSSPSSKHSNERPTLLPLLPEQDQVPTLVLFSRD